MYHRKMFALYRPVKNPDPRSKPEFEWYVFHGMGAGRWVYYFSMLNMGDCGDNWSSAKFWKEEDSTVKVVFFQSEFDEKILPEGWNIIMKIPEEEKK